MSGHTLWFAHRLDSWSKLAKERVKKAADTDSNNESPSRLSEPKTSTSSDESPSAQKDSQKSSSSFEECSIRNSSPTSLQHQSKSFPPRHIQRTSSISSESSIENLHQQRGSSPQIRFSASDGRGHHVTLQEDGRFLYSRSPSPCHHMRDLRAISLDARSMSPSTIEQGNLKTSSPSSQGNLFFSSGIQSNLGSSPKINRPPLLLPPRETSAANAAPPSPLGALQLDLYTRHAGPIVISCAQNSVCVGKLHLRVTYDSKCSDLAVHLIEAHNLCLFDEGGFRNPFVRLELRPEVDQRKRETNIVRMESNPYFDQHFKFPISRDQLSEKELILQVLDSDRSGHDISGELKVSISDLDLMKSNEIWGDIVRVKIVLDRPELLVSLNYLPQAERLTVNVMKARNLDDFDDIFVKLYLIQNGKRIKKKKTGFSKKSFREQIWNDGAFTFNLPSSSFNNSGLEIYILENGNNESNAIGSCGIGCCIESIGKDDQTGRNHWFDMIHNPRKPTLTWHPIIRI